MPSTPYDLVKDQEDLQDSKLYADQAFYHGISFQAKFIGWQEVPRPSCRSEIVHAMRRIRYECKIQNMKKRKVTIEVSVDGVKVCLKKKKRKKKQWDDMEGGGNSDLELMNHPIYRIFYVSHDSNDLKIFSYIARDGSTDTFKCSVFKSNKKSQAMRIVRTVGQAFEVCHKISVQKNSMENGEDCSETPCDTSEQDRFSEAISLGDEEDIENIPRKDLATPDFNNKLNRPDQLDILKSANIPKLRKLTSLQEKDDKSDNNQINKQQDDLGLLATTPISGGEDVVTLRKQLEQQTLQTRQAMAQLMMVREQLISETNARLEAQARTQQLLQQNRELLEHIVSLGGYNEPDRPNLTATAISLAPQLSSTAKVARWFAQIPNWSQTGIQSLSRPESGFVSEERSEKVPGDEGGSAKDLCDEYLLVEGTASLFAKLSAKKRKKLMGLRLGKVTTF